MSLLLTGKFNTCKSCQALLQLEVEDS